MSFTFQHGDCRRTFTDTKTLLDLLLSFDYFQANEKGRAAIPYTRANGKVPLVVIVGDNASGKSFLRRLVTGVCIKAEVEPIRVSMEGRQMGGIMSAFVYGDECFRSTGENSAGTVLQGISTCRHRTKPHIICWDEPDLGLSDAWAAGMGDAIREFALQPGAHTLSIFLMTHSRPLVARLKDIEPFFVHVGVSNGPKTVEEWLTRPVKPKPLEKLAEESRRRFLAIRKILDRK
jgi:hypothetical protein